MKHLTICLCASLVLLSAQAQAQPQVLGPVLNSRLGVPNGAAQLGPDGKVPPSQLPPPGPAYMLGQPNGPAQLDSAGALASPLLNQGGTARPATSWLSIRNPGLPKLYFGGVSTNVGSTDPAVVGPLLATGSVGLYQHLDGMSDLFNNHQSAWQQSFRTWLSSGRPLTGGGVGFAEMPEIWDTIANYGSFEQAFGTGGKLPQISGFNPAITADFTQPAAGEAVPGSAYTALGYPGEVALYGGSYHHAVNAFELAHMKSAIDNLNSVGALSACINYTPNLDGIDFDNPFATSTFWSGLRTALTYSGCLMIDSPPGYFMLNNPYVDEPYRRLIAQQVQWMNARGYNSIILLSPRPGDTYPDVAFLEETKRMIAYLSMFGDANGGVSAVPNAWAVLDYSHMNGTPQTGPESLLAVAEWVGKFAPVTPPGATRPGAPGSVAWSALPGMPAFPAVVAPAGAYSGPITAADLGLGDMAGQSGKTIQVDGGQINGTPVGPSTPSTGAFTSLSASAVSAPSARINGTDDLAAPWVPYTPAILCDSGTVGSVTSNAVSHKVGHTVFMQADILITANGSCAGTLNVGLPYLSNPTRFAHFLGHETSMTGRPVIGSIPPNGSTVNINNIVDGGYPGGTGYKVSISGQYESAQ